jgi:hypothetical protein
LSYLRAGKQNKKKKKDKGLSGYPDSDAKNLSTSGNKDGIADLPIYEDVGDYVPNLKREDKRYSF